MQTVPSVAGKIDMGLFVNVRNSYQTVLNKREKSSNRKWDGGSSLFRKTFRKDLRAEMRGSGLGIASTTWRKMAPCNLECWI